MSTKFEKFIEPPFKRYYVNEKITVAAI